MAPRSLRPLSHRLLGAALPALAVAGLATGDADARLIPPPGPWPTDVAGAANPLVGTPFVLNGAHATADAELRVWLPAGRRRVTAITRTVGRTTAVRGHLRGRAGRRPIGGATLTVAVQNVYAPRWIAGGTVRTNRKGDFRAILPPGYHRRVGILYYPSVTHASPIFSRRLLVRAKSRVDLDEPVHNGRAYRFTGRVSAGIAKPPALGLLVALQVRNRRGVWVTARLRRTAPSGRFRIAYTFPTRNALTIRVVAPAQAGWALYAGSSGPRRIDPG